MFHLAPHSTLNTSTSCLSFPPPLCYCRPLLRTQTCCPRIQLSTVKIQGRMAFYGIPLLHKLWVPKDRAQQDGQTTTPPDSDLEDEQKRKMLASPLYLREREENEGQARACHSERESLLTTSSSRELKFSGKPDSMFSCHSESSQNNVFPKETEITNQETVSTVLFILFLNLLTRRMLGSHFLMETRITCFINQGLKLWSRNMKWDLLTVVSMSSSNKLMLKDWNYILNLEENNFAHKKNYLWMKKRFEKLRYEIYTRWEKWRERKNYESTNSLCKNWEKVMRQYKGSLHKCRKCKSRWSLWMIQENF